MKALYLETSAVLTWLLGEPRAAEVISIVHRAQNVATSILTIIETQRALVRAETHRLLSPADAQELLGLLARGQAAWHLMEISAEIQHLAGRKFPVEPVRTLDAIHLSTALVFLRAFPGLSLLSYDRRILENARALGINCAVTYMNP
jgi:predicted nucleic acid-binding protein